MAEIKDFSRTIHILFVFFLLQFATQISAEGYKKEGRRGRRRRSGGSPRRLGRPRRMIAKRPVITKIPPLAKTTKKKSNEGDIVINIRGMVKSEGHMPEIIVNDKPPQKNEKTKVKAPAPFWGTLRKKETHMPKIIINDYPVKEEKPEEKAPSWGVFAGKPKKKEKYEPEDFGNDLNKFGKDTDSAFKKGYADTERDLNKFGKDSVKAYEKNVKPVPEIGIVNTCDKGSGKKVTAVVVNLVVLVPILYFLAKLLTDNMEYEQLNVYWIMAFSLGIWWIFKNLLNVNMNFKSEGNFLNFLIMVLFLSYASDLTYSILFKTPYNFAFGSSNES